MKKFITTILAMLVFAVAIAQNTTSEPKLDIFKFVGNADWLNVALFAAMSISVIAGYVGMARKKLKQVGELLILLYEYTDDKVLDKKEREEIWRRILALIGKSNAEATQDIVKKNNPKALLNSKRYRKK